MISKDDVKHVAGLSRIHLSDEEITKLTRELTSILTYIEKLEKLDVSNVEPTSHALPLKNVTREDRAELTITQKQALNIAVEQKNGAYTVPKIIE